MLKQRIISAVVLLLIVLLALFYFPPVLFAMTCGAICVLAVWEWCQFSHLKQGQGLWRFMMTALSGCAIYLIIYAKTFDIDAGIILTNNTVWILWLGVLWWLCATVLVMSYPKSTSIWSKQPLFQIIFACVTIVPFLLSLIGLRLYHYNVNPNYGLLLLLYVLLVIWSTDSGAYMFGRLFGKHKLAPQVSPGKTWEGAFGGAICALLVAFIYVKLLPQDFFLVQLGMVKLLIITLTLVAISVIGDLTESMFKREAKIKDSSNLIPGHGGVLDRIDSLTAALPWFTLIFYLMK